VSRSALHVVLTAGIEKCKFERCDVRRCAKWSVCLCEFRLEIAKITTEEEKGFDDKGREYRRVRLLPLGTDCRDN